LWQDFECSALQRQNGSHGFLLDHNIFTKTKHGKDWDGDTFTGSVGFEGRYAGGRVVAPKALRPVR
jgi:hypothetical protein